MHATTFLRAEVLERCWTYRGASALIWLSRTGRHTRKPHQLRFMIGFCCPMCRGFHAAYLPITQRRHGKALYSRSPGHLALRRDYLFWIVTRRYAACRWLLLKMGRNDAAYGRLWRLYSFSAFHSSRTRAWRHIGLLVPDSRSTQLRT